MVTEVFYSIRIITIHRFSQRVFLPRPPDGMCFFSHELQGVYVTQSVLHHDTLQYLEVTVMPNSVSIWGYCKKKMGNHVLLYDQWVVVR